MFRIDSPGAAPGNVFTEGDPSTGTPATVVSADWLNAVQAELANAIEAAGISLDKTNDAQLLAAIRVLQSGGGSNPVGIGSNLLINGDFGIFQRATSAPSGVLTASLAAATTAYKLDRWQSSSDGGGGAGVATITRQAHTPGQTSVPGFPTFFARHAQTVAATVSSPALRQKIEGVGGIGGTVTLDCWIKADASRNVTLKLTQTFGSGGSPDVTVGSVVFAASTAWARARFTIALPSVSGKTFGPGDYLLVEFLMPTGATFSIDFSDAELISSPTPALFQRRGPTVELDLCRRYFEKSWPHDVAATTCPSSYDGTTAGDANGVSAGDRGKVVLTRFIAQKRGVPTIVWFAPSNQTAGFIDSAGGAKAVASTTNNGPASTGYPVPSSTFDADLLAAHWTADAEL